MSTLHISDLSTSKELDAKAMAEVHGGADDQANATSQSNTQVMAAAANVANGSAFAGPATIQSDNTFDQDAHNRSRSVNVDFSAVLRGLLRG